MVLDTTGPVPETPHTGVPIQSTRNHRNAPVVLQQTKTDLPRTLTFHLGPPSHICGSNHPDPLLTAQPTSHVRGPPQPPPYGSLAAGFSGVLEKIVPPPLGLTAAELGRLPLGVVKKEKKKKAHSVKAMRALNSWHTCY